jgi:hypothetical protein
VLLAMGITEQPTPTGMLGLHSLLIFNGIIIIMRMFIFYLSLILIF